MAKHVIYGFFGFLAASVLALAIYLGKPAPDQPIVLVGREATTTLQESGGDQTQTASVAVAGDSSTCYEVVKVIDGDTITIKKDGANETIRFIGINAPETNTCFAAEATQKLKSLLASGEVSLELDGSQGERDKYDRLLAYVFSESGVNTNLALVEGGFAKEYTYSRAYKYQKEFKAAEAAAKAAGKGLWAANACPPPPAPAQTQTTQTSTQTAAAKTEPATTQKEEPAQTEPAAEEQKVADEEPPPEENTSSPDTSGYTCSSNTYNCSDFSTHAEAQAVFDMCGGVSNDVHKLDANKDGEACESLP